MPAVTTEPVPISAELRLASPSRKPVIVDPLVPDINEGERQTTRA